MFCNKKIKCPKNFEVDFISHKFNIPVSYLFKYQNNVIIKQTGGCSKFEKYLFRNFWFYNQVPATKKSIIVGKGAFLLIFSKEEEIRVRKYFMNLSKVYEGFLREAGRVAEKAIYFIGKCIKNLNEKGFLDGSGVYSRGGLSTFMIAEIIWYFRVRCYEIKIELRTEKGEDIRANLIEGLRLIIYMVQNAMKMQLNSGSNMTKIGILELIIGEANALESERFKAYKYGPEGKNISADTDELIQTAKDFQESFNFRIGMKGPAENWGI